MLASAKIFVNNLRALLPVFIKVKALLVHHLAALSSGSCKQLFYAGHRVKSQKFLICTCSCSRVNRRKNRTTSNKVNKSVTPLFLYYLIVTGLRIIPYLEASDNPQSIPFSTSSHVYLRKLNHPTLFSISARDFNGEEISLKRWLFNIELLLSTTTLLQRTPSSG